MPGLVRKLLVFASVNGLVVQSQHGGPATTESHHHHHKAIHIDYQTRRIRDCGSEEAAKSRNTSHHQLESHGIIGLFSIASYSFLVAITKREQVAQIFGKPIYVITDVAFLPLSGQDEATRAIKVAAADARKASSDDPSSTDSDLSDDSDTDETETAPPETPGEVASSPTDDVRMLQHRNDSSTSIVQDVITKRGQYGRFASQWFSKQGWGVGKSAGHPPQSLVSKPDEQLHSPDSSSSLPSTEIDTTSKTRRQDEHNTGEVIANSGSIETMLPKIIRTTRLIMSSRSFFFSYDFNLTRRMALLKGVPELPIKDNLDPLYFWNRKLAGPLLDSNYDPFLMPIIQGFVGQRSFAVHKADANKPRSASIVPVDNGSLSESTGRGTEGTTESSDSARSFLLTLISRRSTKRSGLRYLRRGIDDEGNCANCVETEQILSAPDWTKTQPIRSFVQIRGSIPLYFSQSPYSFKPIPVLHHSSATNEAACKRHFNDLKDRYGGVQAVALVDKHGGELLIGEAYEKTMKNLADSKQLSGVDFEWFDFHAECRGMKFENVERLVQKLHDKIASFGETVISNGAVAKRQTGIFRSNCMDCLDRTNVAESAFGQYILQNALAEEGFEIDLLHDEGTTWFNTLWADNGDAISRQYAGTAALKGDFTRTRKRNYRGALNDFSLTLSRYYNNMVNDYFSQAVIDVLLGNLSWKIFEDFESNMMSADPGISIDNIRETAIETCRKLVVQDETEDLIHGWTMLVPAQENTLRTLPFEEAVVLLTDAAIYCCKFDWATEKVASFEKVDLRSLKKVRYGTYITSTLTAHQMDEKFNAGIVIVYQPGADSTIRTNTRSLSNYTVPAPDSHENRIDGGTGILSWLSTRPTATTRTMALKVISTTSDREDVQRKKPLESPHAVAERIGDEIRRAVTGSSVTTTVGQSVDLVEEGDIISLADAKKRTGYIEQLGHSIKKLVWT